MFPNVLNSDYKIFIHITYLLTHTATFLGIVFHFVGISSLIPFWEKNPSVNFKVCEENTSGVLLHYYLNALNDAFSVMLKVIDKIYLTRFLQA